jgi:hypothetical protein
VLRAVVDVGRLQVKERLVNETSNSNLKWFCRATYIHKIHATGYKRTVTNRTEVILSFNEMYPVICHYCCVLQQTNERVKCDSLELQNKHME